LYYDQKSIAAKVMTSFPEFERVVKIALFFSFLKITTSLAKAKVMTSFPEFERMRTNRLINKIGDYLSDGFCIGRALLVL